MLARVGGLRYAHEHRRHLCAVELDHEIRRALAALDLDGEPADLGLDYREFALRRSLSVAKGLRRARRKLLLDDLQIRFAGFDELAELRVGAGQKQKMWRRMHQRFGASEQ